MIDGEELDERFAEFVRSLETDDVAIDAGFVVAVVTADDMDKAQTSYYTAWLGKGAYHRCVGLLHVAEELLSADCEPDDD